MPNIPCNTCGHLTPDDQTYCERCGAALRESRKGVDGLALGLGFVIGLVVFAFLGSFVNILALSAGTHRASAIDFAIVLIMGAAVVALVRSRRTGGGFVVGMLIGMLGGFAVCGGIFASSPS